MNFRKHILNQKAPIKFALESLNEIGTNTILFSINDNNQLIGSVTDGDIRRGILKGYTLDTPISEIMNPNPKSIKKESYSITEIKNLRESSYSVIPVTNNDGIILNIITFKTMKSYLPIDVVVMAGGLGSRLKPLTNKIPKPLLKLGGKSIIDYNIDRLLSFGVENFWISIRHLSNQIKDHFENRNDTNINIEYVNEVKPLGTIGAVSQIKNFKHDYILVINSDILTNLDYESFFQDFIERKADMSVVTIPYSIKIPYAVLETKDDKILSFKEKPTYTYYSNGGIYLIKKSILSKIPKNKFFNSTNLMDLILEQNLNLISYSTNNYWLDIGTPNDYLKAQKDIKQINF